MAAVARKLLVQVWHTLIGNPPTILEKSKSLETKLTKLTVLLGKTHRAELMLPKTQPACVLHFRAQIFSPAEIDTA